MFKRHPFVTLFLVSSLLFLAHYLYVGNGVWGDGRYYYVIARSWVIDHDIDFQNERLVNPFYFDFTPTPIGRVGNKYSIGTPLMWLPAFLTAHGISLVGSLFGLPSVPDGYGHLYRLAIGFWSVGLVTAALYLIHQTLKLLFPQANYLNVIVTLALGTHLFYYFALDPITSHAPSVFVASLIVFLLARHHQSSILRYALILGLLTGLLGMIRPHDLIFVIPILILLRKDHRVCLAYLASTALAYTPQIISQWLLYGSVRSPYFLTGSSFAFHPENLLAVIFSTNNGLFLYSPLWLVGVIGLFLVFTRLTLAKVGLSLFALQTAVLGSWSGWWGGESFGGRMFLSLTPFIAIGLMAIFQTLPQKLKNSTALSAIAFTTLASLWYLFTH